MVTTITFKGMYRTRHRRKNDLVHCSGNLHHRPAWQWQFSASCGGNGWQQCPDHWKALLQKHQKRTTSGAGISRSSGIPSGWDIVIDLLKKLAAQNGEKEITDFEQWYQDKYGKAVDYSSLLGELVKTSTLRVNLMKPYFEPTEEEAQSHLKNADNFFVELNERIKALTDCESLCSKLF